MIYLCKDCKYKGPCILTWQKEHEDSTDFRKPEKCPWSGEPAKWVKLT